MKCEYVSYSGFSVAPHYLILNDIYTISISHVRTSKTAHYLWSFWQISSHVRLRRHIPNRYLCELGSKILRRFAGKHSWRIFNIRQLLPIRCCETKSRVQTAKRAIDEATAGKKKFKWRSSSKWTVDHLSTSFMRRLPTSAIQWEVRQSHGNALSVPTYRQNTTLSFASIHWNSTKSASTNSFIPALRTFVRHHRCVHVCGGGYALVHILPLEYSCETARPNCLAFSRLFGSSRFSSFAILRKWWWWI